MKNIPIFVVMLTIAALVIFGLNVPAKSQSASSSSVNSEVQYQPGPALKTKANSPTPGPNAKQKTKKGSIGEGEVMITTTDSNNDFWVEQIDLEGKGKMTEAQMLWDNTEKVLYTFADQTMTCKNGKPADGDMLVAIFGKGNTPKMPAGSGWWMASLDAGECGMKTQAIYGCKFNQNGKNTACGIADLNEKTHELMIIEETTSR